MPNKSNIHVVEELALSEGGVFTTAQAARLGIPRDALAYAARVGRVERIVQGAYRLASTADDGLDELRAIWKLTNPASFTHERAKASGWDGIAACGPTAASILGVGDFYVSPYYISTPRRINSRRGKARFVRSDVDRKDVIWHGGIPVMRPEVALASLVHMGEEPSLVADAFVDAVRRYGSTTLDIGKVASAIGPQALKGVMADAGIGPEGPRRLIRLDRDGHVALVEGNGFEQVW